MGAELSIQSQKIISCLAKLVPAALLCGLLACAAGGPNALTGSGGAVGDAGPMAAPTQPSGVASPRVEAEDEKDLSVVLEGSYPLAVANDPQNANSDQVEVTLQGHVTCAGHPEYGCKSGRILRMLFKRESQFVEGLLTKDPGGSEEGYFEFKFTVSKQELYEHAGTEGRNLWQFMLAPKDYSATMLREKQDCNPAESPDCRGPNWTPLFYKWSAPLPEVDIPSYIGPPEGSIKF